MARAFGTVITRQLATSSGKAASRNKLIGSVHAACARKGLRDDDRKAIQADLTGKASLADMTMAEITQVLDHLNRDRPKANPNRAHIGKVRALWWTLYWLGAVDKPNDAAIDSFVKRQTGIDTLRFLGHRKAASVIEALKAMAHRAGVEWPDADRLATIRTINPDVTMIQLERHAVISAIWKKLRGQEIVFGILYDDYLGRVIKCTRNAWFWTDDQLDQAIKLLGKKWRRHCERGAHERDG